MVLISPAKKIHIGKGRNFGGGGTPPPPDNVLRILFVGSQIRWGIINNTANYTVDYGDSTVYNGTTSPSFVQQTKTYASSGAYTIDFIFNNANDYTRFEIASDSTIGYINNIINLDKKTNLNRFVISNVDVRSPEIKIVGTGLGSNPRHELQSTKVKKIDYSGAEFGNMVVFMEDLTDCTSIKFPVVASNYNTLAFSNNPLITNYDLSVEGAFTGGTLRWSNSTALQTVTMSPTVNNTRNVSIAGANLPNATGTLNLSRYQRLGGTLNMPNCTWSGLTLPTLSGLGNNIISILLNNSPNYTAIDFSPLGNYAQGIMRVHTCAGLTGVTMPTNTNNWTNIELYNDNLTGTLNLSPMTRIGGVIRFENNSLLTGVTFPTTASGAPAITVLYAFNCNITGVANLSGLAVNFGGAVHLYGNPLLTGVTLPSTSNSVTQLFFYNCAMTGLDITPLTGTLNGLAIRLENNNMNATNVNQLLIDLDTKGWTGGILNTSGTGNAAPTGAGITARTNLIGKGWTVTTN